MVLHLSAASYIDYADFSHHCGDTWSDVAVEVLVYHAATESWTVETVSILDAVFDGTDSSADTIAGFTQAADDALQVIELVHEYQVPAPPTTESVVQ